MGEWSDWVKSTLIGLAICISFGLYFISLILSILTAGLTIVFAIQTLFVGTKSIFFVVGWVFTFCWTLPGRLILSILQFFHTFVYIGGGILSFRSL